MKNQLHTKTQILAEFKQLPGVGDSIALDLWNLGFRSIDDLKHQNADDLYFKLCHIQGQKVDRCMLYVFRCIIYAVTTQQPESHLLQWWNWKDSFIKENSSIQKQV